MNNPPNTARVDAPEQHGKKDATLRYLRDTFLATALYVGVVFAAALISRNLHPPQWVLVVMALITMAPVLLMLRVYLGYLRTMDEFQRRLQTESLVFAAGVTVLGSFTYGFLEDFADLPHMSMFWVFPVFCMVFAVAHVVIQWRYK